MVRLVLFDIDGTLIHTGGAGEKAFGRVFASLFNVPGGTERLQFSGRTDPAIVREFFVLNGIEPSPANFMRFFEAYVFWLEQMLSQLPGHVHSGVHQLLDELKALPKPPLIGLLTGNVRLGAEIKLSHFGLWHLFQMGGFGDDHEDRNVIAGIARDRGGHFLQHPLEGNEVLVIGDTPLDVACARAIGARVLAVATGKYRLDELKQHKPDLLVESLEQVPAESLCHEL